MIDGGRAVSMPFLLNHGDGKYLSMIRALKGHGMLSALDVYDPNNALANTVLR